MNLSFRDGLQLILFVFIVVLVVVMLRSPESVEGVSLLSVGYARDFLFRELLVTPPLGNYTHNASDIIVASVLESLSELHELDADVDKLLETINMSVFNTGMVSGSSVIVKVSSAPSLHGKQIVDTKPVRNVGYAFLDDGSYIYIILDNIGASLSFFTYLLLVTNTSLSMGILNTSIRKIRPRVFVLGLLLFLQSFILLSYARMALGVLYGFILLSFVLTFTIIMASELHNIKLHKLIYRVVFTISLGFTAIVIITASIAIASVLPNKRLDFLFMLETSDRIMAVLVILPLLIYQLSETRAAWVENILRGIPIVINTVILIMYLIYHARPLFSATGTSCGALFEMNPVMAACITLILGMIAISVAIYMLHIHYQRVQ